MGVSGAWSLHLKKLDGVEEVLSGYINGHVKNPTYKQVSSGGSGHIEAVQISYDPSKVSYEDLLQVLWRNINPTDAGGQFVDRGPQYATGIFYHNENQRALAEKSKKSNGSIKTIPKDNCNANNQSN